MRQMHKLVTPEQIMKLIRMSDSVQIEEKIDIPILISHILLGRLLCQDVYIIPCDRYNLPCMHYMEPNPKVTKIKRRI
jgi:hypothetical protein